MYCCYQVNGTCKESHTGPLYLDVKHPVGAIQTRGPIVGNQPDDVKIVQNLLNKMAVDQGGPAPLLKVDGLCGPLTIDAIKKFQQKQFPTRTVDKIVDPHHHTIYRLNTLAFPEVDKDLITLGRNSIARVHSYILLAIHALENVETAWTMAIPGSLFSDSENSKLVNENFHLDRSTDRLRDLRMIKGYFRTMTMVTGHQPAGPNQKPGFGFLDAQPKADYQDPSFAYAWAGGFLYRQGEMVENLTEGDTSQAGDRIYLTRRLLTQPHDTMVYAIIHELAHFVGGRHGDIDYIQDRAYFHKQLFKYEHLSAYEATTNADSYGQFCWMVNRKTHFRPA